MSPRRRIAEGMERRPTWRRFLRTSSRITVVLVLGIPVCVASAGAVGIGALVYGSLEGTIPEAKPPRRLEPSHVYLMNADGTRGEEIATFREFEVALPMKREDVPQVLKDAVVASEDRQFWSHRGVDPLGIARAAYVDVIERGSRQGASTITQQLVRDRFLTREQTLERKFNEVLLATRYERDLVAEVERETGLTGEAAEHEAKERILFDYLRTIYFGGGAYGAKAAAETYFRKDVKDLTASEAAALVGIIPSPTNYSPRQDVRVTEQRRRIVLQAMRDINLLNQAEYAAALDQSLWWSGFGDPPGPRAVLYPAPTKGPGSSKYPYYVDTIHDYLEKKYGTDAIYHGGLQVYAAIDERLQAAADAAVGDTLSGTSPPLDMSLVSVEPATGMIKAMVGGRDFNRLQVNLATAKGGSGFPPGSSFKAFVVAEAFEQRLTDRFSLYAGSSYQPKGCREYKCIIYNSDPSEAGTYDLRTATAMSVNTYFVPLIERLGPQQVAELAARLGVTHITPDKKQYDYQEAVGRYEVSPLDMAAGYAVLANRGVKADVTPVAKVVDGNGVVIEDNTKPHGTQVLEPGVADWTTDVLRGPIERGTATNSVHLDRVAAGKTGTYDSHMAAWFVGYVPQLATAVWMGHNDGLRPLSWVKGQGPVYGGGWPAQTWNAYMVEALKGYPVVGFTPPVPLGPPDPSLNAGAPAGGGGGGAGDVPVESVPLRQVPSYAERPLDIPADCGGPCVANTLPPTNAPRPSPQAGPVRAAQSSPESAPPVTSPATTAPNAKGSP